MGRAALLALLAPALLAGCLAGGPDAPAPAGQIDGAVVDHLLRPFANQTVYLSPLGWRDQTSPLGGFTFRDVPVGAYTLVTVRDGTRGTALAVEVGEGLVAKAILQLMPLPEVVPTMDVLPHSSRADFAFPGTACDECAWTVPLDGGAPAEAVFEARWDATGLGDGMRFEVRDDRGDLLYLSHAPASSPVSISIQGADIPAEARSLAVKAAFGPDFAPRPNFRMESVLTLYYGATKAELLHG